MWIMFKQTQPKGPYHQCAPRHACEGEITFWGTLKEALNKHFDDKPWHFTISGNLFKSFGKAHALFNCGILHPRCRDNLNLS